MKKEGPGENRATQTNAGSVVKNSLPKKIPARNRPMHDFVSKEEERLTEKLKHPETITPPWSEIKLKYAKWAYHRLRRALERKPSRLFHG
tara:strand:+ start:472 stop:741 length:270 start_codon:yes stop_codon:yes gene_type:complete